SISCKKAKCDRESGKIFPRPRRRPALGLPRVPGCSRRSNEAARMGKNGLLSGSQRMYWIYGPAGADGSTNATPGPGSPDLLNCMTISTKTGQAAAMRTLACESKKPRPATAYQGE